MTPREVPSLRHLGGAIHDARKAAGLTQVELAQRAGVSREWLIGIERGGRPGAEIGKILSVLRELNLIISITRTTTPMDEQPQHDTDNTPNPSWPAPLTEALAAISRTQPPRLSPAATEATRKLTQRAIEDMRRPHSGQAFQSKTSSRQA